MIALIQRVTEAKVEVEGQLVGQIQQGILLLLGVEQHDSPAATEKLCNKVLNYRIFADQHGKMNLNLRQVGGKLLVVSQFTLVADTQKGNRPGFSSGADPVLGEQLYEHFVLLVKNTGIGCETGRFGTDMRVSLVNDGPVSFILRA
jgi:D-tyrosyl-tRNA(Tyr) deacylase